MDKDRIAGAAKQAKGAIKEAVARSPVTPSSKLTGRAKRSKAGSKMPSVA